MGVEWGILVSSIGLAGSCMNRNTTTERASNCFYTYPGKQLRIPSSRTHSDVWSNRNPQLSSFMLPSNEAAAARWTEGSRLLYRDDNLRE